MGGLGSGGWNASGRMTVEGTAVLSVKALKQQGGLRPGASSLWRWSRGGEPVASISTRCEGDRLALRYAIERDGETWPVHEQVALERRGCRFGGARVLFECPRCARSVLHLHLWGGRFVCRGCARLTYTSRRERQRDRHLRAANRLRRKLGDAEGAARALPLRPKGMWRRTYARMIERISAREDAAMEELAGWIMALSRKTSRAPRSRTRFW